MPPLFLAVLNRDYSTPFYNPYKALLVQGGHPYTLKLRVAGHGPEDEMEPQQCLHADDHLQAPSMSVPTPPGCELGFIGFRV